MALESIRIERIKVKDLPALADAAIDGSAPGSFVPITKQRAIAHTHNPNAKPDDVGLLLAKEGHRNVGYFGLMPVMLQHEGKLHKVFWLTTWAVSRDYLGKGLGSALMEAALALKVDLAIVGSKPARRVSAKYGFYEVKTLDYVQIDFGAPARYNPISLLLRLTRRLLAAVKVSLHIQGADEAATRAFEWLLAPLLRPLGRLLLTLTLSPEARSTGMKPVEQVRLLGEADAARTGFVRSPYVINWMLAYPWVLPIGQSESEKLDYGFTDARPGFRISGYQAISLNQMECGFACFQSSGIRGRTVLRYWIISFPSSLHQTCCWDWPCSRRAA